MTGLSSIYGWGVACDYYVVPWRACWFLPAPHRWPRKSPALLKSVFLAGSIALIQQLHFDNRTGIGGRLGVFFVQNLAIELDGSYNPLYTAEGDFVRYIPWHAGLVYNIGIGSTSTFLIGARYTDNWFREAYRETEHGIGGLLGFRLGTGSTLSIRVDGTIDYIFNPKSRFSQNPPIGVQGIPASNRTTRTFTTASRPDLASCSGDTTRTPTRTAYWTRRISVPIRRPATKSTPTGVRFDSDGDGVKDGLDQCPSSPPGDKVDANGCSLDTTRTPSATRSTSAQTLLPATRWTPTALAAEGCRCRRCD